MAAIILANQSGGAKGLPPSTCKQHSATMVTCTAPAPGITEVTFRTYPSLTALYDAYTAQVTALRRLTHAHVTTGTARQSGLVASWAGSTPAPQPAHHAGRPAGIGSVA
jgi:hypothetical protein